MTNIAEQVQQIRQSAAYHRRADLKTLRLSGPDRVRFLNGMVTQDVTKLGSTKALWTIKTNNRGRVEALFRMWATEDAILIYIEASVAERIRSILDQYIIMDDCVIEDISADHAAVSVMGEKCDEVLSSAGFSNLPAPDLDGDLVQDGPQLFIRDRSFGAWGVEIHCAAADLEPLENRLRGAGAFEVSPEALEIARVESGVLRNSKDLDEDTIPMEARLEFAINFEKGCYVGQEVIARATNLGQVNYLIVGLRFDGDGSGFEGAELRSKDRDKVMGEVNSVIFSPALNSWIGLAYVHRKYESVGTVLTLSQASPEAGELPATTTASVVSLPFVC
jgi:folate-binding protein YgfZ